MKRTIIEFLIGIPVVVILFTLFEFLYCTFITHTPFSFPFIGIGSAIGVWFIVELVTLIIRKKKENK